MNCRYHCLLFALILVIELAKVNALPGYCQNSKLTEFHDPAPDYCSMETPQHIGCKDTNVNKNKFAAACGEQPEIFPITDNVKRIIVRQHNVYRNIVAKGSLQPMPMAGRMLKMKWDANLAHLAEYAVKKCSLEIGLQTEYSTTNVRYPGNNSIYNKYPKEQEQDDLKILDSQLQAWYDEHRYMTLDSVEHGDNSSVDNHEVSHFIQLVTGLNDRVGCAIVKFEQDKWKIQLMICLYGCNKQENEFTYPVGRVPGSLCKCGSDREFKNLCSSGETVGDCGLFKYYKPPEMENNSESQDLMDAHEACAELDWVGLDWIVPVPQCHELHAPRRDVTPNKHKHNSKV
ncbi:hypothetical protein ACLKA7_014152 [Drosophila subpalustris]